MMTKKDRYHNVLCGRCSAPKLADTETVWCDACVALPSCDECGMPSADAAGKSLDECTCGDSDEGGMSDYQERMWERRQMGLCDF
jgi:hypothetical protein